MCEHEWTIVYIAADPIGISCERCDESRPIGKEEAPTLALLPGGIYRIPTPSGQNFWSLQQFQVQNELNQRSHMVLEFLEAPPVSF